MIHTDFTQIFLRLKKGKTLIFEMISFTLVLIWRWPLSIRYDGGSSLRDDLTLSSKWGIPHPLAYVQKDNHFSLISHRQYEHSSHQFQKEKHSRKERSFFAKERTFQSEKPAQKTFKTLSSQSDKRFLKKRTIESI